MITGGTPGAYLHLQRIAAGVSLDDVAHEIVTEPHLAHHERRNLLEQIETGVVPISIANVAALRSCFDFDVEVLLQLAAVELGIVTATDIDPPIANQQGASL